MKRGDYLYIPMFPDGDEEDFLDPVDPGAPDQVENFPVSATTELPGDELDEE